MCIPNLHLKRFIGSQGQSYPQLFFYGCLLPFVLSVEPLMHPLLTGRCPARQGDNQIISPVGGKCQSFPLQMAEGKPGVGVVTGVICCSWMSMEGTQGTGENVGGFALTLTHQLQLMPTAKPSPKSLHGFGRADLVCLVGQGAPALSP